MRPIWAAIVLAVVFAAPGLAAADAHAPLSYKLTVTGSTYWGVHPSGTIRGILGGVGVDGTYAGGTWTLQAYGHAFAGGTYACVTLCRFTGTTLAGRRQHYLWISAVPTWEASIRRLTGQLDGLFSSPYDWSALVSAWAQSKDLPLGLQTRVTLDAQMGM